MKKRLTVNVDAQLVAVAKRHARDRGVSLSSLVEESLREVSADDEGTSGASSSATTPSREPDEFAKAWAARWRAWFSGELPPPVRSKHPRYRYLDDRMGDTYGVRWGDDDEPLDAPGPPTAGTLGDDETDRGSSSGKLPVEPLPPPETQTGDGLSFVEQWYGKFKPAERHDDPRYDYLAKKYDL